MKIRTVKYIIKEGVVNAYKNKLMSLASLGIMTATLLILGVFLMFVFNLDYMMNIIKEKPDIKVFLNIDLDESQAANIQDTIRSHSLVEDCVLVTKKEALEKVLSLFEEEDKGLFEGIDESVMQFSFIVKPYDNKDSGIIANNIKLLDGVEKVSYYQDAIEFFIVIEKWVRIISALLVMVLITISIFIVSNTIKLTVYARRKEINIMKFVGATDAFIRWPFFIEGVIIGIFGAVFSYFLTRYGYMSISVKFNEIFNNLGGSLLNLLDYKKAQWQILFVYAFISITVGAMGSFISVRKHLQV